MRVYEITIVPWLMFAALSEGSVTCREYTQEPEVAYVLGVFTGMNAMDVGQAQFKALPVPVATYTRAWLDTYCIAHPDTTLATAAVQLRR
jgi:hypothetical protein